MGTQELTDVRRAVEINPNRARISWSYTNRYGIRLDVSNAERSMNFNIQEHQLNVPVGLPIGKIGFVPEFNHHLVFRREEHEDKLTEILLYLHKGAAQFAKDMTRKENQGFVMPAVLYSRTNNRLAHFARRMGFHNYYENNFSGVIGATNTVRRHAKLFTADKQVLRTLEHRSHKKTQ